MPSIREIPETMFGVFGTVVTAEILNDSRARARRRMRLALPDGGRVVIVSSDGAWEDGATMVKPGGLPVTGTETVTVQRGRMVIATRSPEGEFVFDTYRQGGVAEIDPNQWHATYVEGCIVAVISGDWNEAKRQPTPEFDAKLPAVP